jgi:hypothetical protein
VVTPGEFFADLPAVKRRIAASTGPCGDAQRREPIPFRFFPAVPTAEAERLASYQRRVMAVTRTMAEERSITNLPWYTAVLNLGVLTSLAVGRHDDAGRAAARYAGAVTAIRQHLDRPPAAVPPTRSPDQAGRLRARLDEVLVVADETSHVLLSVGATDEFGDLRRQATAVRTEESGLAAAAATAFLERLGARQTGGRHRAERRG